MCDIVRGNLSHGSGHVLKDFGNETIIKVQMHRFASVGIANSFKREGEASRIEMRFKS